MIGTLLVSITEQLGCEISFRRESSVFLFWFEPPVKLQEIDTQQAHFQTQDKQSTEEHKN